jgi:hypothetical protein
MCCRVTGIAVAGMYMLGPRALASGIAFSDGLLPALIWRAMTDGMAGASRARAAAWYTSSGRLAERLPDPPFHRNSPTLSTARGPARPAPTLPPNSQWPSS